MTSRKALDEQDNITNIIDNNLYSQLEVIINSKVIIITKRIEITINDNF